MHVIAAKAVAFGEALQPEFKRYAAAVVENAKVLAETLVAGGLRHHHRRHRQSSDAGRSRPKKLTGKGSEHSLEEAGITCNKNGIPFDPEKPAITSGVRLGTPAATTRGFGTAEFRKVGAAHRARAGRAGEKQFHRTMRRSSARCAPKWRRFAASFRSMTRST